jgi:hypothetical protein
MKGIDSLIILTSWLLRKEHNPQTFIDVATSAQGLRLAILEEAALWHRASFLCLSPLLLLL